jgi:cyclic pyranopterin phosphate synthase
LRYEEIETIVRAAAALGINKVRLTGGEPLVRLGIDDLVRRIARVPAIDDLAMTTNGVLLARHAEDLAEAGLQRLNISLDTLSEERFGHITRCGDLNQVLDGIHAARRAGLDPIKINTVVIRGLNDDEVVSLAARTLQDDWWNIRFIELMPVGNGGFMMDAWRHRVVTAQEVRDRIEAALGVLEPAKVSAGSGPARYYRLPTGRGTVGFITPISEHFCYQCNRLRLTSDGQLRPCLLSDEEIDLRTPLRQGAGVDEIADLIVEGINRKPVAHRLDHDIHPQQRAMSEIGG